MTLHDGANRGDLTASYSSRLERAASTATTSFTPEVSPTTSNAGAAVQTAVRTLDFPTSHQRDRCQEAPRRPASDSVDDGIASAGNNLTSVVVTSINDAPTLKPMQFLISENSINGAFIGPVAATDPDTGRTKSFCYHSRECE